MSNDVSGGGSLPAPPRPAGTPSWWGRLGRWLPSQCAVCHSWPAQSVCPDCLARFAPAVARCPACALAWRATPDGPACCPACVARPLPLARSFAGLDYAFPWAERLTGMKFRQQTGWAGFFADRLLQQDGVRALLACLGPTDWLLPMPLSRQRLAERGFNQAWVLAQALHRQSGCQAQTSAQVLLRTRHTERQSELSRAARQDNVRGAFAVADAARPALAGRHIVLVDDVMTSGASLGAAAHALLAAGAASASALVAARTPD